jgi:hypothetical protein
MLGVPGRPQGAHVWPRPAPQAQAPSAVRDPAGVRPPWRAHEARARRAASDTAAPSQPLAAVIHSYYSTPLGGAAHQPHTTAQCAAAAAWLLAAAGEGDHGGTALITGSQGKL